VLRGSLVVSIQGIAAGDQAIARGGGAVGRKCGKRRLNSNGVPERTWAGRFQ